MRNPNKYVLLGSTTALVAVLAGTAACSGESTCFSPRAVSEAAEGDSNAVAGNQSTWQLGRLIVANNSRDEDSFVARRIGYRHPDGGDWQDSKPVPDPPNGSWEVKIGTSPVEFSVIDQFESGSSGCKDRPDATFSAIQKLADMQKAEPNLRRPDWP